MVHLNGCNGELLDASAVFKRRRAHYAQVRQQATMQGPLKGCSWPDAYLRHTPVPVPSVWPAVLRRQVR
eukprot:SAG11_NODE_12405_length_705_cov_1.127063_1_plen_68_part_10